MDPNSGLSQSSPGAAVTGEDPRQLSNSWLLLTLVFHIWEGVLSVGLSGWPKWGPEGVTVPARLY